MVMYDPTPRPDLLRLEKPRPPVTRVRDELIVRKTDESMDEGRLERIKKRILGVPRLMETEEILVKRMVKDPQDPTKEIEDPHERIQQRRMDVFDPADSVKKALIHFHTLPDHDLYEKDWGAISEAFMNMRMDIEFLIQKLEGK
jgi:septation ring formation regulator EzrA